MPRPVAAALSIIAIVALWLSFAPPAMGGATNYVIVDGKSMQPTYYTGDLIVLRKQAAYQVGDIAAFVIPANGAYVIHRIIEIKGDRYVLQGDNNNFIDEYNPTADEILGKAWIQLPQWGTQLQKLSTPAGFTIQFMLVGALLLWLVLRDPRRNRHRRLNRRANETPEAYETPEEVLT